MRGKQDWSTPPDLFAACEKRFGWHGFDLMANASNAKCENWIGENGDFLSESADVPLFEIECRCWINPPFAITAAALGKVASRRFPVTALVLAAPSTKWFRAHACGKADVYFLTPRVRFLDGLTDEERGRKLSGGDRDLMILDYNRSDRRRPPCVWDWKRDVITEI